MPMHLKMISLIMVSNTERLTASASNVYMKSSQFFTILGILFNSCNVACVFIHFLNCSIASWRSFVAQRKFSGSNCMMSTTQSFCRSNFSGNERKCLLNFVAHKKHWQTKCNWRRRIGAMAEEMLLIKLTYFAVRIPLRWRCNVQLECHWGNGVTFGSSEQQYIKNI